MTCCIWLCTVCAVQFGSSSHSFRPMCCCCFFKFIGASYSEGKIFYWYFRESCKMWALRQECWTKTQSRHLQAFCWWVTPSSWPENSPAHCEGAEEFERHNYYVIYFMFKIIFVFPLPNKDRMIFLALVYIRCVIISKY